MDCTATRFSFGARIIAIAEGYEAMTNDRPYRKALTHSMTIAELWRESGKRYDPRLVDIFVRVVSPLEAAPGDETWKPELLERVAIDGRGSRRPRAPTLDRGRWSRGVCCRRRHPCPRCAPDDVADTPG